VTAQISLGMTACTAVERVYESVASRRAGKAETGCVRQRRPRPTRLSLAASGAAAAINTEIVAFVESVGNTG